MSAAGEWLAFGRDLIGISALATTIVYLLKLLRPSFELDRLGYLALVVATPAVVVSFLGALIALHEVSPWATFALSVIVAFWYAEGTFGTRLFGLVAGLGLMLAYGLGSCSSLPLGQSPWRTLAALGALTSLGMGAVAAGTGILHGLYHHTGVIVGRRTSRFFNVSPLAMAEIGYRLNAWTLPLQIFALAAGSMAMALHQLTVGPLVAWATALTLQAGYAVWCRPTGYEPGFRPWLLAAMLGPMALALRGLGIC